MHRQTDPMRLIGVSLENFRCYRERVHVPLGDFAALIGRNDAGKSTILEALAIFFGVQKADQDDASKNGDRTRVVISCQFDQLPESIVLDSTFKTSFEQEYLLNRQGLLEVEQVFDGTQKAPGKKIYLRADHPTATQADDLITLTRAALVKRAKDLGVDLSSVNQTINAELRAAIRDHLTDLELRESLVPVSADGAKEVFGKIQQELPSFFLFSADRPSTDQDVEAQDPMRAAVRIAIDGQKDELEAIARSVNAQLTEVVSKTLEKISAMSPSIAKGLTPRIGDEMKWDSVFKVSLHGESGIPINKRGSGVRRMVLLGFLQAQAELKSAGGNVIYAIEEPETGQHPDHQKALLNAVRDIAEREGAQVIMTTHTPTLGRLVPEESLRYISVLDDGTRKVLPVGSETFEAVTEALGILPDHRVKVFVGVEGKHDMSFLNIISHTLSKSEPDIADLSELEASGQLIYVPAGGSNVALWVSRLRDLKIREFHLFDRDLQPPKSPKYHKVADEHNAFELVEAVHTGKRELENYLHVDAIRLARPGYEFANFGEWDSVPAVCAQALYEAEDNGIAWADLEKDKRKSKANSAKSWLNMDAVGHMTAEMLNEIDGPGDLRGWLRRITQIVRSS
ncbi:ATP-binding protein [Curtobacterium sp. MCJR17_020]|uniref:ATP-binding protein n=1 Tax=Curtobacterium sp. MCJR17_020 TaxID=2175619 RepID=UPI000DAA8241|nr:ATP-binding protein [Curtobacterium sp. MCJR17_020]WIE72312.1 ATP-binding protein [Curtobacterium sp. MCJR17_020]